MKKSIVYFSAITTITYILAGCSSVNTQYYANQQPSLRVQHYFNGKIQASGMLLDRNGTVTRRFAIDMHGHWHGNDGVLHENIHYSDGEQQTRQWQFHMLDANHFTGTAQDAVGVAKGEQYGNTIHMTYTLQVPVKGSIYNINFDDWIYAIDAKHVFNRALLSKYGFNVGEILITYDKK